MTTMRSVTITVSAVLLLGALPSTADSADFRVIVNPSNSVTSLTSEEVSRIFLKKARTWENGASVQVVDLPASSSTRASFSKAIHRRSVANVKSYWQQQLFSGKDVPPQEKSNDREVLDFVRGNPNAIGYVSSSAPLSDVKVITVSDSDT